MSFTASTRHVSVRGGTMLLLCVVASAVATIPARSAEPVTGDDDRGILRLDPFGRQLVPVAADEMKEGHLYSFHDPRSNRRVWSFVQPNGELWRAFGPGTTQLARRLDIRVSESEALAKVAENAPKLAQALSRTGGPVYIRLGDDNEWELAPYGAKESIFDIETGRRWEWYRDKYLPVTHTFGHRWAREEGRYVPVPKYHPSMLFGPR